MERMTATCAGYVESDLIRLSQRRQELLKELSHVDAAILERTHMLSRVKADMTGVAASGKASPPRKEKGLVDGQKKHGNSRSEGTEGYGGDEGEGSAEDTGTEGGAEASNAAEKKLSFLKKRSNSESHEDGYDGPAAFAVELKDNVDNMLFSVDRSDAEEVVVYLFSMKDDGAASDIVTAHRAFKTVDGKLTVTRISAYEWMVAYGAKVVPNHEREDRETVELSEIGSKPGDPMGELVGAVEVPCAPDVIIDIWRIEVGNGESSKVFSTTSINGVLFCLLERISLRSETHWGLSSVVEISLHGKHPVTGSSVVEIIDMNGGGED
jgi:hypothetical protein